LKRVFVSYSRNNLDAVTQLVEDMNAVGIVTWHDQALTGGQRWWDNILANIRECDIFIFALSPESWDSEACKSELNYAVKLGKPILPVLVSEGININLLSPPLNEIQITDYRQRDKDAAFALLKSINTAPSATTLPDPLPTPPIVPVSYLSTLKDRIDSIEPLSPQDQVQLLFELEEELQEGRSPTETRDLLMRLRRRDELLAKIATKIDAALKSPEGTAVAPVVRNIGFREGPPPSRPRQCPKCGTMVDASSMFCGKCGTQVPKVATFVPPKARSTKVEGSKSRSFRCTSNDAPQLIADVKGWLDSLGFDSQQMNAEGESLLLQIKKRGGWRDYLGMATSLNILFNQTGDTLAVEIGAGKWLDKAAVGTVSMFILWPLAITAGFGAWEQMQMPEKIFDFIGNRLGNG
jgi:hypothetical protein